ncbi:GFA family protein [Aminobacter anthyllidis]|uniref:GFA family protein n=1 Tax=Aminobacter anthyllidis TaxID=1035067 RepID=A0A9X1AC92_9HYPH|nr:GFA family protein [Aminobacter anthyllidis]MBT1157251.1 GFA family protein [Aminobacter anthyllidis]
MQDQVAVPFRSGSCVCRGVTFRVTGDPLRVGICHCTECRKTSGAPFAAFAVWPSEAFEQRSGFTTTYAGRSFCTTCGGRVFSVSDEEVEVMIGSLDEAPTDLTPEYELWAGRRETWFTPLPDTVQFEGDRDPPSHSQAPGPVTADEPSPP